MLIYVSGPLQGAVDLASARALYTRVAQAIEAAGHRAYVPHLHTDPETASFLSSGSVYDRDVAVLTGSDVIVAHVGAPSTGVGAELVIAREAGLRLIGLRRSDEAVSRFAEGLLDRAGGELLTFGDEDELGHILDSALNAPRLRSADAGRATHRGQAPGLPLLSPLASRN